MYNFPTLDLATQNRIRTDSIGTASRALYRIGEILDRADEREAHFAISQATEFVRGGWNGTDSVDESGKSVHTPGVADRTWQDMQRDETDPAKEMKRIKDSVREQEFYTSLSPAQKRKFDRQWRTHEMECDRVAAELHGKLVKTRAKEQNEAIILANNAKVSEVNGADDATFNARAAWATTQNFGILAGTQMKHPEILDNPNVNFNDIVKSEGWDEKTAAYFRQKWNELHTTFHLSRVDALVAAGSNNQPLGAYSPEQCLLKAAMLTNELNGNGFGLRPDGTKKGTGWLGLFRNAKGEIVSEFSFQSDAVKDKDGNRVDIPMLVPGQSKEEVQAVLELSAGGEPDKAVIASAQQKAVDHARRQIEGGKSVWKNSGYGKEYIDDTTRNRILAKIENASRDYLRNRDYDQSKAAKALDGELDKMQWEFIEDPMKTRFDDGAYLQQLDQAVRAGVISRDQGLKLFGRYGKMHKDRDQLERDIKDPSAFADKSNPNTCVRLKQMIVDAERNGTSISELEDAVERAKGELSATDYFALWHDARKKRDGEDDRVTSQVFSEFLKIGEETADAVTDPKKRRTKDGASAVETLLGSDRAEYVRSGRWWDPDFTVEDVDAAVDAVRAYVKEHPGDSEGAKKLLGDLVDPFSKAARAKSFRERIQVLRRSRQWSVNKAFGQGDAQ